jgi:hypothetical protein
MTVQLIALRHLSISLSTQLSQLLHNHLLYWTIRIRILQAASSTGSLIDASSVSNLCTADCPCWHAPRLTAILPSISGRNDRTYLGRQAIWPSQPKLVHMRLRGTSIDRYKVDFISDKLGNSDRGGWGGGWGEGSPAEWRPLTRRIIRLAVKTAAFLGTPHSQFRF